MSDSPEVKSSGSGKALLGTMFVFLLIALIVQPPWISALLPDFLSRSSQAEGEIVSEGEPFGSYTLPVAECFSGEREGFFGVWVVPKTTHTKKGVFTKGGLKAVKSPIDGWQLSVESPTKCQGWECESLPLPRDSCSLFDISANTTGLMVNRIRAMEGQIRIDCALPEGGTLKADLQFKKCI